MEDITQEIRAEIIINRVNLLRVTVNEASEWKKKNHLKNYEKKIYYGKNYNDHNSGGNGHIRYIQQFPK